MTSNLLLQIIFFNQGPRSLILIQFSKIGLSLIRRETPFFLGLRLYLICSLQPACCTHSAVYRATPQSAIRSPQSAVPSPQSAVRSLQSPVRSPQSSICCLKTASLLLLPLAFELEEPPWLPDDPKTQLRGGDPKEIVRAAYS